VQPIVEKQVRKGRGLRGAVIDIEGNQRLEGFSLEEALEILDGERGGVLTAVLGRAGDMGKEGDVGETAKGGVFGKGLSFVDIEANLEVVDSVLGDAGESRFVDDGATTDVNEGAARSDGAKEFFGDDMVIFFGVGSEFDNDIVLGEEVFEGG
jgi:hypothetical protein